VLGLVVLVCTPAISWLRDSSQREFQSRSSAGAPDLESAAPTFTTTSVPPTSSPPVTTTPVNPVDATVTLAITANRQGNSWSATVTATVIDQHGAPVQGAVITGTWNPVLSGDTSCTAGTNGQCTMTQAGMEARDNKPFIESVSFTVTAVTKSGPGFSYQQTPPPSIGPITRPV
jgi:hypothetical protein